MELIFYLFFEQEGKYLFSVTPSWAEAALSFTWRKKRPLLAVEGGELKAGGREAWRLVRAARGHPGRGVDRDMSGQQQGQRRRTGARVSLRRYCGQRAAGALRGVLEFSPVITNGLDLQSSIGLQTFVLLTALCLETTAYRTHACHNGGIFKCRLRV